MVHPLYTTLVRWGNALTSNENDYLTVTIFTLLVRPQMGNWEDKKFKKDFDSKLEIGMLRNKVSLLKRKYTLI